MALFPRLSLSDLVGNALGLAMAPVFGLTSFLRRARTFHPRGVVFTAEVTPVTRKPDVLAERLRGEALVRFSNALWKSRWEHLDVLGLAVRFRQSRDASVTPEKGDQDLLFATIWRPWTMAASPFTTRTSNFLKNSYYAVSPFDAPGVEGRCYFRIRPVKGGPGRASNREDRLRDAVSRGKVVLRLELRREGRWRWEPVALLTLREAVEVDQEALAFWPFRDGRGVVPRGLVHGLRRGVYAVSQRVRPRWQG